MTMFVPVVSLTNNCFDVDYMYYLYRCHCAAAIMFIVQELRPSLRKSYHSELKPSMTIKEALVQIQPANIVNPKPSHHISTMLQSLLNAHIYALLKRVTLKTGHFQFPIFGYKKYLCISF